MRESIPNICQVCFKEFYPNRKKTMACSSCWISARHTAQKLWQEQNRLKNIELKRSKVKEVHSDDCSKCNHFSKLSEKEVCRHEVFISFENHERIITCRIESKEWCPMTKHQYYRPIKDY